MKKDIIIFGSCGVVGSQVVEILLKSQCDNFNVIALVTNTNYRKIQEQASLLGAKNICVLDKTNAKHLEKSLGSSNIVDLNAVTEMASKPNVISIVTSSGSKALNLSYKTLAAGNTLITSNKETIIYGGKFLKSVANEYSGKILPLDSEHVALYQVIEFINKEHIDTYTITASGGSLIDVKVEDMKNVTKKDVLNHPIWNMGSKITVDSATLMNKGLEVIEASILFDIEPENIHAVIHRQSMVHSIVNLKNSFALPTIFNHDMRLVVQFMLNNSNIINNLPIIDNVSFNSEMHLTFEEINLNQYPCFKLAKDILHTKDQSYIIKMNAANELVVDLFLKDKIKYIDIYPILLSLLSNHKKVPMNNMDDIFMFLDYNYNILHEEINQLIKL